MTRGKLLDFSNNLLEKLSLLLLLLHHVPTKVFNRLQMEDFILCVIMYIL